MPAQKRSSNPHQGDEEDSQQQQQRQRRKQSRRSGGGDQAATSSRRSVVQPQEVDQLNEQQQEEDQPGSGDQDPVEENPEEDSDGSGTDPEDFDEFVTVFRSDLRNNDFNERHFFAELFEARKDVECPICLGIIKKTRTVMGCLHRFCRECIDKSMRLGNNECPACRIHCASRRSLRDDLDYDALIDAIYPDVEKYEEEELVFREEDKTRNKQIQASIEQISKRQLEALNRRRKFGKDGDDVSPARVPRSGRNSYSRRRNPRVDLEAYDGNGNNNDCDGSENPSPADNRGTEIRLRRPKRRTTAQPSTSSPSTADPDGVENSAAPIREEIGNLHGPIHNPETLTWGRGGARSHTRHGSGGGSRANRGTRLSKLIDHLESVGNNTYESEVHLSLVSLDKAKFPNLEKPYLCCPSTLSIEHLREHVAQEIKSQVGDLEIMSVARKEEEEAKGKSIAVESSNVPNSLPRILNWPDMRLQVLEGQETLAGLSCSSNSREVILAYGRMDTSQVQLSTV